MKRGCELSLFPSLLSLVNSNSKLKKKFFFWPDYRDIRLVCSLSQAPGWHGGGEIPGLQCQTDLETDSPIPAPPQTYLSLRAVRLIGQAHPLGSLVIVLEHLEKRVFEQARCIASCLHRLEGCCLRLGHPPHLSCRVSKSDKDAGR